MKNTCIMFMVEGNLSLMRIQKVSNNTYSPLTKYSSKPRQPLNVGLRFLHLSGKRPKCSDMLPNLRQQLQWCSTQSPRHSDVLLIISQPLPLCFHSTSSAIQVTSKAGQNALLGYNSLLNLILVSLHSASSHTLLEASSD